MKAAFHYSVWQYKKFAFANLTTVSEALLTVVPVGLYFFTAKLVAGIAGGFITHNIVLETNCAIEKFATFGAATGMYLQDYGCCWCSRGMVSRDGVCPVLLVFNF